MSLNTKRSEAIKTEIISLLDRLVHDNFPKLSSYTIAVKLKRKKKTIAATYLELVRQKIKVTLDEGDINRMPLKARIGVLAHELCHAERDTSIRLRLRLAITALNRGRSFAKTQDERETDELVIAKGYGQELLQFQRYHDRYYKSYKPDDGLTQKEIRQRLAALGKRTGPQ